MLRVSAALRSRMRGCPDRISDIRCGRLHRMTAADGSSPAALDLDLVQALIAELASKSDLVWVQVDDAPARPVWSVWHEGAVTIVTGGLEQPNPGLTDGGKATVILRSKENRARQVVTNSTVMQLAPGSDAWVAAAKALHPKRLNAPDGELQPERWARESTVWLLRPTGEPLESPGRQSDASHRAEPMVTEATTLARRPFHAGRATKRRR